MDNEDNKRSATDILLELESRIIILEKRFQNTENLLKIIAGKLNKMNMLPVETQVQAQSVPVVSSIVNNSQKKSKFAQMAAQHGLEVEDDDIDNEPINRVFKAKQQDVSDEHDDMFEADYRGNTRDQRAQTAGKKSSISQVIKRGDTPLYIANVEVFDEYGKLINQTRTNTKGRWLMALAPGDYRVHVLKRFPSDSGKLPIDTSYQISVPPSSKPVELDSLILTETMIDE
jgi:hypothetical protein